MVMKVSTFFLSSLCCFFLLIVSAHSSSILDSFIHCLSDHPPFSSNISILSVLYSTTNNASYQSILDSSISNLRFSSSSSATPKPLAIITPLEYSHVQATVTCSNKLNGPQIRIRSGGHDFEGLSSRSQVPFLLLDLRHLRSVAVDVENESAWVESGATIGQLCYSIAEKSPVHGFPAGTVPAVGVGGHFSGGGVGYLIRKHGLAADNVVDALVVGVDGRILDKESMGSDLFWALRGGGGGSFGVVLAWKIRLVRVPPVVTVFKLTRTLEQGGVDLMHKWQYAQPKLDEDVSIVLVLNRFGEMRNLAATFSSLFLGRAEKLLEMMELSFPELLLRREDCIEMSWIESVLFLSEYPGEHTTEILKDGSYNPFRVHLKLKSDLIDDHHLLPYEAVEELWRWSSEVDLPSIYFQPYGGIMERISKSETPFPHRKVRFEILYLVVWMMEDRDGKSPSEKYMDQLKGLYKFMEPYVPNNPRGAYVNSRDLDFGTNGDSRTGTTFSEAKKTWGSSYFKHNFERLAIVKGKVDPTNFFYHEQSIPPLVPHEQRECREDLTFLQHQCYSHVF